MKDRDFRGLGSLRKTNVILASRFNSKSIITVETLMWELTGRQKLIRINGTIIFLLFRQIARV